MTDGPTTIAVERLLALLDLEELDDNLFRSFRQEEGWKRVYGGQVLAQALVAASRTVEPERRCHSLHSYFILPGDPGAPIVYSVERARDGKSFTTRRVVAIQHGRPIFNLSASFQVTEEGFEHQFSMPEVRGPDGLATDVELLSAAKSFFAEDRHEFLLRPRAIEIRPVSPGFLLSPAPSEPYQYLWFRVPRRLPNDPAFHRIVLAYVSDMGLIATASLPHPVGFHDPDYQTASLDHAMWFHEEFRVDEWMLYAMDSPKSAGARGLSRGLIYTRDGRLVASTAQEGLLRLRRRPPAASGE